MKQDSERVGSAISPFAVPNFGPAFFAILLAMLAEAMAGSYIALLAVEDIGMSPLELSAFLTIPAASGIAITSLFGHLLDRKSVIWPLVVSLLSKSVGFLLCAYLTEIWTLVLNAGILFGLGAASFSILFAVAKGRLDLVGGSTVSRGVAQQEDFCTRKSHDIHREFTSAFLFAHVATQCSMTAIGTGCSATR
jgi:SET family sugar efflux transporter-like MFS transporter